MFTSIFNFFDKLFHWDSDQGTFTKILSILLALFGLFCLGWLVIASYGIGHTQLAMAHKAGHGGSETLFATLFFCRSCILGMAKFHRQGKISGQSNAVYRQPFSIDHPWGER